MKLLGEAFLITFAKLGLKIEKIDENTEHMIIYISVPEHSYHKDKYGEELSGKLLAKRFKIALMDMRVKNFTVKSHTRISENWTEEMSDIAELEMKKELNVYY